MVHTVHLDDKYANIGKLLQVIRCQEQGVRFENHTASDNTAPTGYMTGKDFWEEADKHILKLCKEYGVL